MVKETFTSEETLIARHFDQMVQHIWVMYGVNVWFAEIMGKRWSYITGRKEKGTSLLPPRRIKITDRFGFISDGWENIPADESGIIISSLIKAVKFYE